MGSKKTTNFPNQFIELIESEKTYIEAIDIIVNLGIKGDKESLSNIYKIAIKYESDLDFEKAMYTFKQSTIAYRITAFGERAYKEEALRKAHQQKALTDVYQAWIEREVTNIPLLVEGMNRDILLPIIRDEISCNHEFYSILYLLDIALKDNGVVFSSPGGSLTRWTIELISAYYGLSGYERKFNYIKIKKVRIALDLISDEVLKIWRGKMGTGLN